MRLAGCTPAPVAKDPEPVPASTATYVGQETCEPCHDDQLKSFAKTIHARVLVEPRPESERGCEACHGPGSAHSEEGGGKGVGGLRTFVRDDPAHDRSAPCLHCHAGDRQLHDFLGGEHALADVGCTDCHSGHAPTADHLLVKAVPELCYGCHADVRAAFAMPEHHKVPEGALSCVDCHQPHGSRNTASLRDSDNRTCFTCHAEVQGPFVFEHGAVLTEGCTGCHENVHGSTNRHLLAYQQVAQLCYQCHTVTPTTHVQPSYRDCTRCHVSIHGSNTDSHFFAP